MRRHFNTFDALRFAAFLKVFLLHLPITAFPVFNFFRNGGGIGVSFFFVLSGFLITYIILEEKERTGTFHIGHFYLRRILRIWPLYYLMIGFAFITPYFLHLFHLSYSDGGYKPDWLLSLTFLENYKMIVVSDHPNVSPLTVMWSLCIEEHFYIIWGLVLYFIPVKRTPLVIALAILLSLISIVIFIRQYWWPMDISTNLIYFAFGAIPAYLLITKKEIFEEWIQSISIVFKIVFIIVMLTYIFYASNVNYPAQQYIEPFILSALFAFLICLIVPQKNSLVISDKNTFSRLGVYTYGLYVYHTIIINLFIQLSKEYGLSLDNIFYAILFCMTSLLATVVISIVSFSFFENQFLKLKRYFY